jgi:hypothetical protein
MLIREAAAERAWGLGEARHVTTSEADAVSVTRGSPRASARWGVSDSEPERSPVDEHLVGGSKVPGTAWVEDHEDPGEEPG